MSFPDDLRRMIAQLTSQRDTLTRAIDSLTAIIEWKSVEVAPPAPRPIAAKQTEHPKRPKKLRAATNGSVHPSRRDQILEYLRAHPEGGRVTDFAAFASIHVGLISPALTRLKELGHVVKDGKVWRLAPEDQPEGDGEEGFDAEHETAEDEQYEPDVGAEL